MRYSTRPRRPTRSGPPTWFVFVLGVALVFGVFYVWQGVQNFIRTGGRGVIETTERAVIVSTATAERAARALPDGANFTPRPSGTPVPECQPFEVNVPNAIVRDAPTTGGAILTSLNEGEQVCVLERYVDTEWYAIDLTAGTRRLDLAFMHESVLRALNPTPTPSITVTPRPTITPTPTLPATITVTPRPTITPDLDATDTPTATIESSPTSILQSA